jgi:hypothetical protein
MSAQIHYSGSDLRKLSRAFDVACRELGIGLVGLDVQKRERLVKRAMKLAHANDRRAPRGSIGTRACVAQHLVDELPRGPRVWP